MDKETVIRPTKSEEYQFMFMVHLSKMIEMGGETMSNNNQVIIERDIHCPYCGENSAVLISETVKSKKVIGCAPVGLKNGCLICMTGGCWTLISGLPLYDIKEENTVNLYGFCPNCGNSYPVIKPPQNQQIR